MRCVSKTIEFNAPAEKVWALWKDVEKTPEWVDGVLLSKRTSEITEGPGLAWREKCVIGQQEVQVDHEVVEWMPLKKVSVLARLPFGGKTNRDIEFECKGAASSVTISMTWDLGLAASFFSDDEMEAMLERSLKRTAENWKKLTE